MGVAVLGLGGGWLSRRTPFPITITPPHIWYISCPASLRCLAQLLQSVPLFLSVLLFLSPSLTLKVLEKRVGDLMLLLQ